MKKITNLMMLSSMLSGNHPYSDNDNYDIYSFDEEVNSCRTRLYLMMIKWLNEGLTYEEIYDLIDNLTFEEYEKLSIEKQIYVKEDARKVLVLRKENKKGNDLYE